jgi:hypothetical protein
MSSRVVGLSAVLLLALVAGGWWWIVQTSSSVSPDRPDIGAVASEDGDPSGVLRGSRAPTDEEPGGRGASTGTQPNQVVPLALDGGLSADERVDELDLDLIRIQRGFGGSEERRLVASRLQRFVTDVIAAAQSERAVALVERRFHHALEFDTRNASRWISVLAGLGAQQVVLANWRSLPAKDQPQALLSLAWDPLGTGTGLDLDPSEVEEFAAYAGTLPLSLGRAIPRDAEPVLLALIDEEHEGYRGSRFRDVAVVTLGVMADRRPDLLAALVDAARADPEQSQAVMYVLLHAERTDALLALMSIRRRPDDARRPDSDASDDYERIVRSLAHVEARLRIWDAADVAALSDPLRARPTSSDERMSAAGGVLALVLSKSASQEQRVEMSDLLSEVLMEEQDPDVAWTELFTLLILHNQELYRPHMSIGYGSDRTVDQARKIARLSAFAHRLEVGLPHERLLAVLGMFGHASEADGVLVRDALRAASRTEDDATVGRWIKLALRFY